MLSKKLLAAALAAAALFSLPALAQVKVGVVSSSTGPTALVGIPRRTPCRCCPRRLAT